MEGFIEGSFVHFMKVLTPFLGLVLWSLVQCHKNENKKTNILFMLFQCKNWH